MRLEMETNAYQVSKINGFSRGLNNHQLFSYFFTLTQTFFFSFILIPNFPLYLQITSVIVYYLPIIVMAVSGYLATVCDPTDQVVLEERRCRVEGKYFEGEKYDYQCELCETSVSEFSKHCSACKRCVLHFDHHCIWINNCVAGKNYKQFIVLIISLGISTLTFCLHGFIFLLSYFVESISILKDLEEIKHPSEKWRIPVLLVYEVATFIFLILDIKLIAFHIYITRKNMSTYDYIIQQRAKNDKERLKKGKKLKSKIIPFTTESPSNAGKESHLELQDRRDENFDNFSKVLHLRQMTTELDKVSFAEISVVDHQYAQNTIEDQEIIHHAKSLASQSLETDHASQTTNEQTKNKLSMKATHARRLEALLKKEGMKIETQTKVEEKVHLVRTLTADNTSSPKNDSKTSMPTQNQEIMK